MKLSALEQKILMKLNVVCVDKVDFYRQIFSNILIIIGFKNMTENRNTEN